MAQLRFSFNKFRKSVPLYGKLLFVLLAFTIMVVASSLFVNNMLGRHLERDVADSLSKAQLQIEAAEAEQKTLLLVISDNIRNMILSGRSTEDIHDYMKSISSKLKDNRNTSVPFDSIYGYFQGLGGVILTSEEWNQPENYDPGNRPWYLASLRAKEGEVVASPVYYSALDLEHVFTYVTRIFDEDGQVLGVLCTNLSIPYLANILVQNINLTENSYGVLLDDNFVVASHRNKDYYGVPYAEITRNTRKIVERLQSNLEVYKYQGLNYRDEASLFFFQALNNGWHLGLTLPPAEYYQEQNNMTMILALLGLALASSLVIILANLDSARNRSDTENRQKSRFLATMSHEIRTPMNAILGIAESQMQNKRLPGDTKEAINRIYNSGDLLLHIINDILDLSKIEAGMLELVPAKYDIASLLNETVHLNMMRFDHKPIKFKLDLDPDLPSELFGDSLRIKQILNNILSNAFKYTEEGEVTLVMTSKPEQYEDMVNLVIHISDTGQGMTPEQVHKLFDEYTRFNLDANRMTTGTGLGMSITRNLIQMMKGNISVTSDVGKGSVFTVILPQKQVGTGILGKKAVKSLQQFRFTNEGQVRKSQIVRESMPYGKVLLVDDVETNIYVAKLLLKPYDLQIDSVVSGFDAIDTIKDGKTYDIIFMDHMMPKMDGIEATKIIRDLGYEKPIVALTANAVQGQAEIFLSNGFDGFISKPIDVRQLNATLNQYIRDVYKNQN